MSRCEGTDSDFGTGFAGAGGQTLRLRILATSDLHAHLCPWDYYTDRPVATQGLARTAGLIAAARAEVANALLFDNGDFLQGSPLGDFHAQIRAGAAAAESPHPVIAAMNLLRYDAVTLGNHEFSHGLEFLQQALRDAAFPVVSANMWLAAGDPVVGSRALVMTETMLERDLTDGDGQSHRLRIGVFGVCPQQVLVWESHRLVGRIAASAMVPAARSAAERLRKAGADLVIALAHTGIGTADAADSGENVALRIAAGSDVDVVIAGHTHELFPNPRRAPVVGVDPEAGTLAGKPAVMPGAYGSHLGVIDLDLRRVGADGRWRVQGHHAGLRAIWGRDGGGNPVPLTESDPAIVRQAMLPHRATLGWTQRPIGRSSVPLTSRFALVTDTPAQRLVAEAQAAHVGRALAGTPLADLPLLSAVAPFRAGGRGGLSNYIDIPAGDLAMRHAADLYMHPNDLVALRLTGAQIADWLERGAGLFNQIPAGSRDRRLIDPDFPSFNFETIHPLTWQVDLSQPPRFDARGGLANPGARRIVGLHWQGRPLASGTEVVLATNSYRAGGGGGFAGTGTDARVALSDGTSSRDAVVAHIAGGHHICSAFHACWGFVPMAETSVLFDTTPTALPHLDEIAALRPQDLGPSPEPGFRRFRLWP